MCRRVVGPCPGGKAARGQADAWAFLARSGEASLEQGQLWSLMSLKVTGCFEWARWVAVLTVEGESSGAWGMPECVCWGGHMEPDLGRLCGAGTGACLGTGQ